MSIENAILELAAAIRELAASNVGQLQADLKKSQMMVGVHLQEAMEAGRKLKEATSDTIEQDVSRVETDAKAEQKKVMGMVEADRKSDAKKAVEEALAKAKKEKETATQNAQSQGAGPDSDEDDPLADSTPLEYEKDVKPKLVQVGKIKQEMVDLLASFGVGKDLTYAKADQLPADKFGAVVAACDKILAARG